MTQFRIGNNELERWMHQNKAQYTGSFVEGCLLDNFVVVTRRGFAAFYEHYINEWSSDYAVEFEAGPAQTVWRRWYEFEERSERER